MPELAQFLDTSLFKDRLESVIINLMSDSVFQIREEATQLLLTLKEKNQPGGPFDQRWLQDTLESKAREFHTHEKFAQRIQTLFLIQRVVGKVDDRFLNEKLIPLALRLSEDPVPNIRFNFAKLIESIFSKLSPDNKRKAEESLVKMVENEKTDFDVKYYAEKALKSISK